ncbi:MAG TPA: hypothetical protein VHW03_04570 [Chthoniobacterales bacterium]|jgi:hypothetical protein|nr:hypothetical protein [Chthoniobacterales bacterium]
MPDQTLSHAPAGTIIPVSDKRYPSANIRLSAALCAMGFAVKAEAEPCTVTIDVATRRRTVTFWHEPELPPDAPVARTLQKLKAIDVDGWWRMPGKYSIEGYDDALTAMRRVQEMREWLLGLIHGSRSLPNRAHGRGEVATPSLHIASAIKACGVPVIAYEKKTGLFVFPKAAVAIAELIGRDAGRETIAKHGADLCLDWMLWALKYHDWLLRMVRNPDCIPLLQMAANDRTLQVSSAMDEREQNALIAEL